MDGTVTAFDADKGFGYLRTPDGRELFFHCTEILDGSRVIEVGTMVSFDLVAGHRGRYEASRVARQAGDA